MSPADAPGAGAGALRTPAYLISIASCMVLSWLLLSRENWLGLALVLIGAVAYSIRLLSHLRRQRREAVTAARGPKARTSAEQQALKSELSQMREGFERNRRTMLLVAVVIGGIATIIWTWNSQLALALLLVAIPPLVLMWRSSRAVRRIDEGLAAAR